MKKFLRLSILAVFCFSTFYCRLEAGNLFWELSGSSVKTETAAQTANSGHSLLKKTIRPKKPRKSLFFIRDMEGTYVAPVQVTPFVLLPAVFYDVPAHFIDSSRAPPLC